jgi:hypothetical protein
MLPLTKNVGPAESGIYALYFKGRLVYIGKATKGMTKSKRNLCQRMVGVCSRVRANGSLQTRMERQRLRKQNARRRSTGDASRQPMGPKVPQEVTND